MTQHDGCGHRRRASAQGHDFTLAALGQRRARAADESRVAIVLEQSGAPFPFPAAGFQREERFERRHDIARRMRDLKRDVALLGEAVTLPAQLFQLLDAERVAQQVVRVLRRVEAGSRVCLQYMRREAVAFQRYCERFHGGAVERDVAQDQRVLADGAGLAQQRGRGFICKGTIKQRGAQRSIGIGADQNGKRNPIGSPGGNHRNQADESASTGFSGWRVGARRQCGRIGPVARRCVERQLPVGEIVGVRLDRAVGKTSPLVDVDRCECCGVTA